MRFSWPTVDIAQRPCFEKRPLSGSWLQQHSNVIFKSHLRTYEKPRHTPKGSAKFKVSANSTKQRSNQQLFPATSYETKTQRVVGGSKSHTPTIKVSDAKLPPNYNATARRLEANSSRDPVIIHSLIDDQNYVHHRGSSDSNRYKLCAVPTV